MNYRPPHDPRNRPSLVPEKKPPGPLQMIVIAIQLILILLLVRLVMLEQKIVIIHIPMVDPFLYEIITLAKRLLTELGLMPS